MEWEDTVMKPSKMLSIVWLKNGLPLGLDAKLKKVAETQAKITWGARNGEIEAAYKAGMEEEAKGGTNAISYLKGVKEGIPKGMREVVEWIDDNCLECRSNTLSNSDEYLGFHKESWQLFKLSRGL